MPWNSWNVSEPIDHTKINALPQAIRDVESSTKIIFSKEHAPPSTSQAGGQHLLGSTRVYLDTTVPTTDPEGNNLATSSGDTSDNGRLACISTGATYFLDVYAATSAGISTSWHVLTSKLVYLIDAQECNGNAVSGLPYGTQATQPVSLRQVDTAYFTIADPSTTATIRPKVLVNALSTGITTSGTNLVSSILPLTYANEESVTLPNGLIIKCGTNTEHTGNHTGGVLTGTVTFATAFPTACKTVICTNRDNNVADTIITTNSITSTGFAYKMQETTDSNQSMQGVDWFAIGY